MENIEEAMQAVEEGKTVHWQNIGYSLNKTKSGEWIIKCVNGYVTPLNGHKPEEFFIG